MQSVGWHRKLSAGGLAHMLQLSGFGGLHTKPGLQPHVRSEAGLSGGAGTAFVGAAHVVTWSRMLVVRVTVAVGPVTVAAGSVTVTAGGVTTWVLVMVDAGMTLVTVVPDCVKVVVTAGTTDVNVVVVVAVAVVPGSETVSVSVKLRDVVMELVTTAVLVMVVVSE